jgi:hypothetical protein
MKPCGDLRLIAVVLVLLGCQSATERCKKIDEESFMHRATRDNEDYVLEQIEKKGVGRQYALGSPAEQARIRREVGEEPNPFRDSAEARVRPPPRPSDLAWYNEHCYEGKPRD